AAHGHHPLDAHGHRQIDCRIEACLRILALGVIGMQQIACGIDRGKTDTVLLELALQPITLGRCPDRRQIEMGARPGDPGPDADLDILDAMFGAPAQHGLAGKLRERVRENANSHGFAFLDAESRSSTSRRALATVVCIAALPVTAAWKARSSSRKA